MKITDVKAVYVDHGPGPRPYSDGGYRDQKRVFGYVEVFSDAGLSGFCPGAAPPTLVEHDLKGMIGVWVHSDEGNLDLVGLRHANPYSSTRTLRPTLRRLARGWVSPNTGAIA